MSISQNLTTCRLNVLDKLTSSMTEDLARLAHSHDAVSLDVYECLNNCAPLVFNVEDGEIPQDMAAWFKENKVSYFWTRDQNGQTGAGADYYSGDKDEETNFLIHENMAVVPIIIGLNNREKMVELQRTIIEVSLKMAALGINRSMF